MYIYPAFATAFHLLQLEIAQRLPQQRQLRLPTGLPRGQRAGAEDAVEAEDLEHRGKGLAVLTEMTYMYI